MVWTCHKGQCLDWMMMISAIAWTTSSIFATLMKHFLSILINANNLTFEFFLKSNSSGSMKMVFMSFFGWSSMSHWCENENASSSMCQMVWVSKAL